MFCVSQFFVCAAIGMTLGNIQVPTFDEQSITSETSVQYVEELELFSEKENEIYTYGRMQYDIIELTKRYPDQVNFSVTGTTKLNRDIYLITLGNTNAKHAIFVQGSIHAREYMTTQLIMNMIADYARKSETDIGVNQILGTTCFYIVPMSNPDGVSISQMGEASITSPEAVETIRNMYAREKKRKQSYQNYLALWKSNVNGVDINRNFDAGWCNFNQKATYSSEKYKGEVSGSEEETKALMKAFSYRKFDCVINYHETGEVIYYDTIGSTPDLSQKSYYIAQNISQINGYKVINCNKDRNCVQGGFGDWVVLAGNTPSVTIEVGRGACPLSQSEYTSAWNKNKDIWNIVINCVNVFAGDGNN